MVDADGDTEPCWSGVTLTPSCCNTGLLARQETHQQGPLSLVRECRGWALIGRDLHSVAPSAFLCHEEPARRIQSPLLGVFCLLLAGSLWHKG